MARALIDLGAKLDAKDANTYTPIHKAALAGKSSIPSQLDFLLSYCKIISLLGNENVVRALVELGAKVDPEDESKRTPLHRAAYLGNSLINLQSGYSLFSGVSFV